MNKEDIENSELTDNEKKRAILILTEICDVCGMPTLEPEKFNMNYFFCSPVEYVQKWVCPKCKQKVRESFDNFLKVFARESD